MPHNHIITGYVCTSPRLRALLEQHSAASPRSMQETQTKLKALSNAVVKLSSQLEQTESENKHLEEDMKRLRHERHHLDSFVHNEQGLRGSVADKYADHRRSEMLSAVIDLELVGQSPQIDAGNLWSRSKCQQLG